MHTARKYQRWNLHRIRKTERLTRFRPNTCLKSTAVTRVIAQQHTPLTPCGGAKVESTLRTRRRIKQTPNKQSATNVADCFAGSLFVKRIHIPPARIASLDGNVNNKFTHNKPFTKIPIGPSNMVMTTDETFGPKPNAQTKPKRQPTMALNTNALDAAPKNLSFSRHTLLNPKQRKVDEEQKRNGTNKSRERGNVRDWNRR